MQKHRLQLSSDESSTTARDEAVDEVAYQSTENDTDVGHTDELYLINADPSTTHVTFPVPGGYSAKAMREFLDDTFWARQILNDEGEVLTTEDVREDDVPKLQVKIWTTAHTFPIDFDAIKPAAGFGMQYSFSQLKLKILNLLGKNHIFVHLNREHLPCMLPLCPYEGLYKSDTTQLFAVEPLVHWATVTPAHDIDILNGRIFTVHRDGVKYHDPLWKEAVKLFASKTRMVFCEACLDWVMNHELPNPDAVAALASEAELRAHSDGDEPNTHTDDYCNSDDNTMVDAWPVSKDSNPESEQGSDEQTHVECRATLQLDGINDLVEPKCPGKSSTPLVEPSLPKLQCLADSAGTTTHRQQDSSDKMATFTVFANAAENPFSSPLHKPASSPATGSEACLKVNDPVAPATQCKANNSASKSPRKSKGCTNSITSTPTAKRVSPRTKKFVDYKAIQGHRVAKREFGREISSNTIVEKVLQTSASKRVLQAGTLPIEKAASPIKLTISHLPGLAKMHLDRKEIKEAKKDVTEVLDTEDEDDSDWITVVSSYYAKSPEVDKVHTPATTPSPPRPKVITPPRSAPNQIHIRNPTLDPQAIFFAKYTSNPPAHSPEIVVSETYIDHLKRVPDPKQKICICTQPANTSVVKIAQCANINCRFVWLHYNCLDKPSKISARFGTMVCQICRNDELFKDLPEVMDEGKADFGALGEQVVAVMSHSVPAVVNPYGIMLSDEDYFGETELKCRAKMEKDRKERLEMGLGSMRSRGIAQSRPYALTQAYCNEGRGLVENEI